MAKNAEKVQESQSEIGALEAEMAALDLQQQVGCGDGRDDQAFGRSQLWSCVKRCSCGGRVHGNSESGPAFCENVNATAAVDRIGAEPRTEAGHPVNNNLEFSLGEVRQQSTDGCRAMCRGLGGANVHYAGAVARARNTCIRFVTRVAQQRLGLLFQPDLPSVTHQPTFYRFLDT